ncbi:ABC transporter ATP-binding protein [Paenibacillaceae bacterium WGS1546]|uniref:ABC transporter ATP-binding protein n=1 Tax=Cohnella sp. WGS1546 TaxID=3366810 RepID=UPI00372D275C
MVVQLENLTFRYARKQPPILEQFSLQIAEGEIVGLVGASGSGKSTLLRLIAGLELPESGRIVLNGKIMADERVHIEPEHRGVGMVFQNYALFPHLTAAENIRFGLHRIPRSERQRRVREMLILVKMQEYADRYPHQLSGGQQQRIALARSLAPRPVVLLMDEPFSSLDAELKGKIREELHDILHAEKTTCLFVSHDRADTEAVCSRTIQVDVYGS